VIVWLNVDTKATNDGLYISLKKIATNDHYNRGYIIAKFTYAQVEQFRERYICTQPLQCITNPPGISILDGAKDRLSCNSFLKAHKRTLP